jgi:hypothetical protein
MRYVVEEKVENPEYLVEVVGPGNRRALLPRDHAGAAAAIEELREVVARLREQMGDESWWERPDGTPVDVVDRRRLEAEYEHVNLLMIAARAVELELFDPLLD